MVTTISSVIALLVVFSAAYNAYRLRGGKLAWSQVFIVIGMTLLIMSMVLDNFVDTAQISPKISVADGLFVLGLCSLLMASERLRMTIK